MSRGDAVADTWARRYATRVMVADLYSVARAQAELMMASETFLLAAKDTLQAYLVEVHPFDLSH